MPALIFDCDGVLADTERDGHRPAFNATFAEVGLPVAGPRRNTAKLQIGGGKERMASLLTDEFVRANGFRPTPDGQKDAARRLAQAQDRALQGDGPLAGQLPARPGIARIVDEAIAAGWTLAVASTSAEESVRAVLEHAVGADNAARLPVFAGDIVPAKKPDPAIYTLALERWARPGRALVIEDSRNGLLAAVGAGLRCVVTVSATRGRGHDEAVLVVTSLGDPGEPAVVLANRGAARPGDYVTLGDLQECIGSGAGRPGESKTETGP